MSNSIRTFSNADGSYQVSIKCSTAEASIFYTINGDNPTKESTEYTSPFSVTAPCVIKAVSYREDIGYSYIVTKELREAKIIGIERNYDDLSSCARLTTSSDPLGLITENITTEPVIATTSQQGSSPFDAYDPWSSMKRVCFSSNVNGKVNAKKYWEGDEGFDTANKDTMVWIPEFWIKLTYDAGTSVLRYYISDMPVSGFMKHPGSGQYVGAFVTSSSDESKSGKSFQVNQSIKTMRTNAKEKGPGWGLIDLAQRSALQWLFIVEFCSFDSQTIFGQTGGESGDTGSTDEIGYHTGRASNDKTVYRYVEDLWNGVYEWTDGFNTVDGHHYVSTDRDNYESDVTEGYTDLGSWSLNGNISKYKYFEDMPWLIGIPEEQGSPSYDQGYLNSSGTCVLSCGGYWDSNSYRGLFCFHASYSSSDASSSRGSRLSYKEPSAA